MSPALPTGSGACAARPSAVAEFFCACDLGRQPSRLSAGQMQPVGWLAPSEAKPVLPRPCSASTLTVPTSLLPCSRRGFNVLSIGGDASLLNAVPAAPALPKSAQVAVVAPQEERNTLQDKSADLVSAGCLGDCLCLPPALPSLLLCSVVSSGVPCCNNYWPQAAALQHGCFIHQRLMPLSVNPTGQPSVFTACTCWPPKALSLPPFSLAGLLHAQPTHSNCTSHFLNLRVVPCR